MVLIRDMRASDVPALRRIYLDSRRTAFHFLDTREYSLRDFDRDTKGERVLVGCLEDSIVGFCGLFVAESFIHHLYCDPQHVHRGVGSGLLEAAIAALGGTATLKCLVLNTPAIGFYLSHGWRILREDPGIHGFSYLMSSAPGQP